MKERKPIIVPRGYSAHHAGRRGAVTDTQHVVGYNPVRERPNDNITLGFTVRRIGGRDRLVSMDEEGSS